ncbi:hypothetical protein NFC73_11345 [Pseudarthrobacter sp. RMG13]|uniref:N-acetyltransferase domain-containing protein n=1 Tax=Pseudarthrobacter humi TaxID=2952523 RepID=A0ABT1LPE6_9MICC|nr:hypothetical protein [Pseudarthrobacter humi]
MTAIDALVASRYPPEIAGEVSPYESARVLDYGKIGLLVDDDGNVIACQYVVSYLREEGERIAYGMRLMVRADYESNGIGETLFRYLCLDARDRAFDAHESLISIDSHRVHDLVLNKMGAQYTSLVEADLVGVRNHLNCTLPLKRDFLFDAVTERSLKDFVAADTSGAIVLMEAWRVDELADLVNRQGFNVIAFARPGWLAREPMFVLAP